MKRSNRLLILLGVFLAVIAMMAVVVIGGGGTTGGTKATPTPTPEPMVQVVVAKVDMARGDRLSDQNVEVQTWTISERDNVGQVTFTNPIQVKGKTVNGDISKGDPITPDLFLNTGSYEKGKSLAPDIAPGKVAVAMEVDQVNGVGTLVVPGDHVDVILSVWVGVFEIESLPDDDGRVATVGGESDVTTKVVIQNRLVLATLLPAVEQAEETTEPAASATPSPTASTETITNSSQHMIIVIEVEPEEAEVIRWAQREEITDPQNYITLGLALRSEQDNNEPPVVTQGITFRQLVTIYGVLPVDARAIIPPDIAANIHW